MSGGSLRAACLTFFYLLHISRLCVYNPGMQKSAVQEAEEIMNAIYGEDPSLWPYGLNINGFKDGDINLIRKEASEEPVGFVGWQERQEGDRKIGYYAVGVLPEYRQQGIAKKAVALMLSKKASSVDEVRATIVEGNEASLATAKSIPGVKPVITKSASKSSEALEIGKALKHLGTGALMALPTAVGKFVYSDKDSLSDLDKHDYLDYGTNTALGTAISALLGVKGGLKGRKLMEAMEARKKGLLFNSITSIPLKSLIFKSLGTLDDSENLIKDVGLNREAPSNDVNVESGMSGSDKALIGLLGATALGGAGYFANKALNQRKQTAEEMVQAIRDKDIDVSIEGGINAGGSGPGRMRITLPTRNPNDVETTIELPMDEVNLSKTLLRNISRDTKRRLREETKRRTRHKDKKKIKELLEEEEKSVPGLPVIDI